MLNHALLKLVPFDTHTGDVWYFTVSGRPSYLGRPAKK
jgi:hypothetical protein